MHTNPTHPQGQGDGNPPGSSGEGQGQTSGATSRPKPVSKVVIGIAVLCVMGVCVIAWAARNGDVRQPVAYNHKVHVDAGMDCAACHTGAREGTHAGIPTTDKCALCHRVDRPYPKTPESLARYLKAGDEIPWVQLHRTRRHVFFSHQRHVTLGGIDCAECHGDVKQKTEPFTRAAFPARQPGMDRCVACHRKERVTTDCTACHR